MEIYSVLALAIVAIINVNLSDAFKEITYPRRSYVLRPYAKSGVIGTAYGTTKNLFKTVQYFVHDSVSVIPKLKLPKHLKIKSPDRAVNTSQILRSNGYPVEDHKVYTSDGYILGMERIRGRPDAPVVLMIHGFLESSLLFVANYHSYQNLPMVLSDEGFDVWLGNFRGTPYSRAHVSMKVNNPNFWAFSMNELSDIDLKSMIDYVLAETGKSQLSFIGHSMGTSTPFALLSEKPEYNEKIKVLIALAPVAKITHITTPVTRMYQFPIFLELGSILLGVPGQDFPDLNALHFVSSKMCSFAVFNNWICQPLTEVVVSLSMDNVNSTQFPLILSGFPTATSSHVYVHWAQMIRDDSFQKYDYGKKKNFRIYGKREPPLHNLENVKVPVVLISSMKDPLADQKDITYLRRELPYIVGDKVLPSSLKYGHYDFLLAKNAHEIIFPYIVSTLKNY